MALALSTAVSVLVIQPVHSPTDECASAAADRRDSLSAETADNLTGAFLQTSFPHFFARTYASFV